MKKLRLILIIIIPIILLVGIFLLTRQYEKEIALSNNSITEPTVIEIKEGMADKEIAAYLLEQKMIKSKTLFTLTVILFNKKMHSGFYEINPGDSIVDIISKIDQHEVKVVKLTFPEGWRAEQIAQRLQSNKVVDYQEFMKAAAGNEGKLFPDTYYLNPRMTGAEVVKMMTDDFEERTNGLNISADELILASIVEREAVKDEERALIAGIYSNRIRLGMKLEADPTVQFARDNNETKNLATVDLIDFKYWQPIKTADLTTTQSDFNTYLHKGLPSSPICNPGLKSIEAAGSPEDTNYLYFLHRDGQIYPSATSAEHEQKRATILGAVTSR